MAYTLGQAAKAVGKSKSAISKAIRNGKISTQMNAHGQYQIDPAELFRVWEPRQNDDSKETVSMETGRSLVNTDLLIQLGQLKTKVEALEEQTSLLKDERNNLRERLDQSEDERRRTQAQLTALLTERRQKEETPAPPQPQGFWQRFWRG